MIPLDGIERAYLRLQAALTRAFESAIDYGAGDDGGIEQQFQQDLNLLGAAFFVILFGCLETRLRELAAARSQDAQMQTMLRGRNVGFDRIVAFALPDDEPLRREIDNWDGPRNDAAHGRRLIQDYAIVPIIDRCRYLDELLSEVSASLATDRVRPA
jgi:hypothetical protein